jgi:hypothetical protein
MLFISVLVAAPFLILTYRMKNRIARWLLILVPPVFLAPLFVLPVREPISAGWLFPLLIFLPISLVILVIRVIQLVLKKPDAMLKIKFIRPSLVILMFIAASIYHRVSAGRADDYAISLAGRLQSQCNAAGHCAPSIDGWQTNKAFLSDKVRWTSSIRKLGIDYPVQYTPAEDGKTFTVTLVHGFNMALCVEGGVGKDLKATYYDEVSQKDVAVPAKAQHTGSNAFSISTNFGR